MSPVYTPKMLAERWACSETHVRTLVRQNKLRAFRLGGKLLRIPEDAVEEFERGHTTPAADAERSLPSPTPATTPNPRPDPVPTSG